jgi:putative Holliday junction resolvase
MEPKTKSYLALDVGEKRIGVAIGDDSIRIAVPLTTIMVDGSEYETITKIIRQEKIDTLVVGYPRNQSGEATAQTAYVESFVEKYPMTMPNIVYQDESLTSVMAEDRLKSKKRPYDKADIDMHAAAIILQDYLETIR